MGSTAVNNVALEGLIKRSKLLLRNMVENTNAKYGFGTLTCTVYDTAWVALVKKPNSLGETQWLFPESFQYILGKQSADGGWLAETRAQVDGILNTMAGLLVLKKYSAEPLQVSVDQGQIAKRVERAILSLRSQLELWDVFASNNVGFEIIVPAILDLLTKEDASLVFAFSAKADLLEIYHAKMSRFKPELLYKDDFVTMTHSLEAFVGKLDFNKIAHHKRFGAMFASPSSTAAYLMNISEWDEEAESYLRHAIKYSTGKGSGGVPGVFPTSHFEYIWVISTLFRAGFTALELASLDLTKMTDTLLRNYEEEDGTVGLAPGIEPDLDNTAKLITTFCYLGEPVQPQRLVDAFEVHTHFRVYPQERDASFSANCNALIALLHPQHCDLYVEQIKKLAAFLSNRKWNADASIHDKWNTSHLYSSMLFTEAFTDLLSLIEKGRFPGVFCQTFLSKAAICLYQTCLRPLLDQCSDGSWGHSIEETAYAILMLSEARKLSFFHNLQHIVRTVIDSGIKYILSFATQQMSYLWSDKVSYGSPSITEAYVLAALRQAAVPFNVTVGSSILGEVAVAQFAKHIELFHKTSLLENLPRWELIASVTEAMLFQQLLEIPKLQILPASGVQVGSYLKMIPLTWTSCNNRSRTYASPNFLYEMMVLSYFTYQVDEFMESSAGPAFYGRYSVLRDLIDRVTHHPSELPLSLLPEVRLQPKDAEFEQHLSRCVTFILENNAVTQASFYDRRNLRQEMRHFLLAHTAQLEDNLRCTTDSVQKGNAVSSASHSYARWVATTSADHIAGPFCFAFAICNIGANLASNKSTKDCFPSAAEKYYAASTCRHLSIMCRMYNDLGSWERDRCENNLNSLHFEEFHTEQASDDGKPSILYSLAQYERMCWNNALSRLHNLTDRTDSSAIKRCSNRRLCLVRLFCDVTDIYGQIYVIKDISSPIAVEKRVAAVAVKCITEYPE